MKMWIYLPKSDFIWKKFTTDVTQCNKHRWNIDFSNPIDKKFWTDVEKWLVSLDSALLNQKKQPYFHIKADNTGQQASTLVKIA